jgi:hypothetical protein
LAWQYLVFPIPVSLAAHPNLPMDGFAHYAGQKRVGCHPHCSNHCRRDGSLPLCRGAVQTVFEANNAGPRRHCNWSSGSTGRLGNWARRFTILAFWPALVLDLREKHSVKWRGRHTRHKSEPATRALGFTEEVRKSERQHLRARGHEELRLTFRTSYFRLKNYWKQIPNTAKDRTI